MNLLCTIVVAPLYLQTLLLGMIVKTDQPFQGASQALSLCPGLIGTYLRRAFYRLTLLRCGPDVCIEFGTVLSQPTIELGRRVHIGCHCSIGECSIGDNTLLGSNVDILSGRNQHYFDRLDVPIRDQGGHLEKIAIGDDCWIGNSSVVMANVGASSIVAAGAVVVHEVDARQIVAGNPARPIGER